MKTLTDLIQLLRDNLKTMAKRANDVLQTLPPLEQFEKTSPIYGAIQNTGYALDFIERSVKDLNGQLDAIDPVKAAKEAGDTAIEEGLKSGELLRKGDLEAKITAGELMRKEDAQAAATAAANERETQIREKLKTVESRRKEVSTAKSATEPALISVELAGRLSSDILSADDYVDRVKKVAARVKDLNDLGVEVPQLLNAALETPVDDAGEKIFSERLSMVKEVAGKGAGKGGRVTVPEPFASNGEHKLSEELTGVF